MSELKTGRDGVPVKHANGIEREFFEIFAAEFEEFFEYIVWHGNDVATAGGSLKHI